MAVERLSPWLKVRFALDGTSVKLDKQSKDFIAWLLKAQANDMIEVEARYEQQRKKSDEKLMLFLARWLLVAPDASGRKDAIRIIGDWGNSRYLRLLQNFRFDPDWLIRCETYEAIAKLLPEGGSVRLLLPGLRITNRLFGPTFAVGSAKWSWRNAFPE